MNSGSQLSELSKIVKNVNIVKMLARSCVLNPHHSDQMSKGGQKVLKEVVTVIVVRVMDVCYMSVTYTTTYFDREPLLRRLYLLFNRLSSSLIERDKVLPSSI